MNVPADRITAAQQAAAEARIRALIERATDDADHSAEDDWRREAACRDARDPEIFHDPRPDTADTAAALAYCAGCPVTGPCGRYADKTGAPGTWGGRWRPDPYSSPVQFRARRVKQAA